MKKTTISGLLMFIMALFAIAGCKSTGDDITHIQPTTATLKVMSQGTGTLASSTLISAASVTVNLPSGVTVEATADSVNAAKLVMNPGVMAVSGVAPATNTYMIGSYTAATATAPGYVVIHLANANGFGIGEFATINCGVAAGFFPTAADFSLTGFKAFDTNGAALPTTGPTAITAGFAADIK
jgi:hypothetical protein